MYIEEQNLVIPGQGTTERGQAGELFGFRVGWPLEEIVKPARANPLAAKW